MTGPALRVGGGHVGRLLADPVARNGVFMMASTVATAGLGYFYWVLAAQLLPTQSIGRASAAMSLVTGISLITNLGVAGFIVERLPGLEGSRAWSSVLSRATWYTAALSAAATLGLQAAFWHLLLPAGQTSSLALAGLIVSTASLTVITILTYAFMAAGRAGLGLALSVANGSLKIISLAPVLVGGRTLTSVLLGWTVGNVCTCIFGLAVLLPRTGQGRFVLPGLRPVRPGDFKKVLGHHFISVGGMLPSYVLPTLTVVRAGPEAGAYFYMCWMLGSAFFMISPALSGALFAEGSRAPEQTGRMVRKCALLVGVLLPWPVLLATVFGRDVLSLFGADYAANGALVLSVLAVSAIPDGVTNLAVAVLRLRGALRTAAALNLAMATSVIVLAWFFTARFGLLGAVLSWIATGSVGAVVAVPLAWRALVRAQR